jgi:hypothetical protein
MSKLSAQKTLFLVLSGAATFLLCFFVATNRYSLPLVFLWLLAILLVIASAMPTPLTPLRLLLPTKKQLFILAIVLLPVVVRVLLYQPDRIHGDDLLTATFSQQYHPLTTNFFSGIPQGDQWVAKFPTPYFLFQKLFLMLTGANVFTVKLSVLPYIIVVSCSTYLIARSLFGRLAGISAVILYAFMAISIYHETLGLHFISSTALYMLFFISVLRLSARYSLFRLVTTGITTGLCYLSYPSSYIALPILLVAVIPPLITKKVHPVRLISWISIGIGVVLAPFITYAVTQENYFVGRIHQVALINGTWSVYKTSEHPLPNTVKIIRDNTALTLTSFVKDGVGGHGGYTFNRQAFFPRIGLLFFLAGIAVLLIKQYRNLAVWLLMLTVLLTYITGMVLTIPPPAYHRLTLAFPFIAIISAAPFSLIPIRKKMLVLIAMASLAVYAGVNVHYAQTAQNSERMIEDTALIHHVNAYYPDRTVYIAAYPSFALGKFFPFFPQTTAPNIVTRYHKEYLRSKITGQYVIIMTLPQDFKKDFTDTYPEATYIPFSDKYGIMVNL